MAIAVRIMEKTPTRFFLGRGSEGEKVCARHWHREDAAGEVHGVADVDVFDVERDHVVAERLLAKMDTERRSTLSSRTLQF